jgi:transposase
MIGMVDRDGGYRKVPCAIQYGYSHLRRDVQDLDQECPDTAEVQAFVNTAAPQLALAMGLRTQPISDPEFARQAAALKAQLIATMEEPAPPLGLRRIQAICRAHGDRLYHWAEDWRIPADHNLAERGLRPTVMARKVSCGSQSDAGAQSRGVLMSVLHTLKKRQVEVGTPLKGGLDPLALDLHQAPVPLLFPEAPT